MSPDWRSQMVMARRTTPPRQVRASVQQQREHRGVAGLAGPDEHGQRAERVQALLDVAISVHDHDNDTESGDGLASGDQGGCHSERTAPRLAHPARRPGPARHVPCR